MKWAGLSEDTACHTAIFIFNFQKGFMSTATCVKMGKLRNPVQRKNTIEWIVYEILANSTVEQPRLPKSTSPMAAELDHLKIFVNDGPTLIRPCEEANFYVGIKEPFDDTQGCSFYPSIS